MENLLKDIRYGFRMLIKSPGFTTVAVISLALGIGANTAIFSIISAFLFAPLPVEEPSRLVTIFTTDVKNPGNHTVSRDNFLDYRDKSDVFTDVLAYNLAAVNFSRGAGETRELTGRVVSGNYFDVLGVKPVYGRAFYPDEDKTPSTHPVVVLSYACWQRDFGGDPSIVGRTISLNRHDFTVIGIAPAGFTGTDLGAGPDIWAPMMMHNELQPDLGLFYGKGSRRGLIFTVIGRLKPGVTLAQAQASLGNLASQLEQEYRTDNEGRNVKLVPLLQARIDPTGTGQVVTDSIVLMSIVGIVLLIACVNVTNLLLARATRRRREIAIRLAIGASRARLIRQLMTESILLSLVGGTVGFLIAFWTKDIITTLVPLGFGPGGPDAGLDTRVLAFALVISVASGVLFGLAPALQASKPNLVSTLKGEITVYAGRRGAEGTLRKSLAVLLRNALVVLQVALSLFALITAGLFVRSLQKAKEVNPGFVSDNVLMIGFNMGREGYDEDRARQFHRQLLERVQTIPGVQSATMARDRPFGNGFAKSVFIEGQEPSTGGRGVLVQTNVIGTRFFE
ncbi:MAG TPA: ABC transporter permease, partial [Blastocatellia bacterium]|nr:ABC transporter permease [Blastocatellia bacterium]